MNTFSFRNVTALFYKQVKDTIKNPEVLILFLIFPIMGAIIFNALPKEANDFVNFVAIFSTIHCVFAPLAAAASIIGEEKEKNTLRILIMSNVNMPEYLIAIGSFILFLTLLTGASFLFIDPAIMERGAVFMACQLMGCLVSASFGACLGLQSRNASAANALAVPLGMVFAFVPMLAAFNKTLKNISRFTFGQQISDFIAGQKPDVVGIVIIAVNLIVLLGVGILLYRRVRTEE